jgi:hypothetical protein
MGVERVALEHHRHVAPGGVDVVDHLVADEQLAVGDVLQPGDHPQGGGLAAARGPQQDHELPVVDGQIEGIDGHDVVEALGHVLEGDAGQCDLPMSRPAPHTGAARRAPGAGNPRR